MKVMLVTLVMSLWSAGQVYPSDKPGILPSPWGIIAAIAALTFFFAFIRERSYVNEREKAWKNKVARTESQDEEEIKKFFFLTFGFYPLESSEATAQKCLEVMAREPDPQRKEILALLCARAGVKPPKP